MTNHISLHLVVLVLPLHEALGGGHPGAADLVRELEEEEDGDHDAHHHQADEGPVGEHPTRSAGSGPSEAARRSAG